MYLITGTVVHPSRTATEDQEVDSEGSEVEEAASEGLPGLLTLSFDSLFKGWFSFLNSPQPW